MESGLRKIQTSFAEATGLNIDLSKKAKRTLIALLAASPVIIWLVLYKYIALVYNIILSFSELSITGEFSFVGLQNYQRILTDPIFTKSLVNTVILFGTIPVSITIALGIAILLNQKFPGYKYLRSLFFLPYISMAVALAIVWQYMFKTENGILNHILLELGLIQQNIPWLSDSTWAIISVFTIQVWKTVGFYIIIILAGLQTIPKDIYEVSQIGGATRIQRFRYITLPLLRPTLGVCFLVGMVISFRIFDIIWVLTQGGPGHSTEILLTWIYKQAFTFSNFGYAAVLSLVMVVLTLAIALIGYQLQRRSYQ